ncbi:hypothetical protein [Halomonas sp. JS92-SW72]|uniref:hypothetical protein n=1 Tax=Halomonas sp. JS92-SW72 TaxID=2306583 RepID=UPI000E5B447A|nr:hypothetical protein [Halomonas sp. JS92-SW72]AXY44077.1 hypothetical protein D1793_18980 [Halomonas sp. JS92-SW72]
MATFRWWRLEASISRRYRKPDRLLGGKSLLLEVDDTSIETTEMLPALFDRGAEYQELLEAVAKWQQACPSLEAREAQRGLLQLQRRFQAIIEIDFFPGTGREQAVAALADAEAIYNRCFVPDEPKPTRAEIGVIVKSCVRQVRRQSCLTDRSQSLLNLVSAVIWLA